MIHLNLYKRNQFPIICIFVWDEQNTSSLLFLFISSFSLLTFSTSTLFLWFFFQHSAFRPHLLCVAQIQLVCKVSLNTNPFNSTVQSSNETKTRQHVQLHIETSLRNKKKNHYIYSYIRKLYTSMLISQIFFKDS